MNGNTSTVVLLQERVLLAKQKFGKNGVVMGRYQKAAVNGHKPERLGWTT